MAIDRKLCCRCHERERGKSNAYCNPCGAERAREWEQRNPGKRAASQRRARVKYKYGISLEEYEALLAEPCAICGAESEVLDHCHASGLHRLALCHACNKGLGMFADDPERLRNAAEYVS
jgi:hypothetical protein